MDVFGQFRHFTPLFTDDLVEILPNQSHFKQVLTRFQADLICLTIDKVKPQLCICPNSGPFCHPVCVVNNYSALLFFHQSNFDYNSNNLNSLLSASK